MVKFGSLTLEVVRALSNDDGVTVKHGEIVRYSTGYQVATHGITCTTAEDAYNACMAFSDGLCGIWLEDGVYYVDHSFRVDTKRMALYIGRKCNQLTVYDWKRDTLHECRKQRK